MNRFYLTSKRLKRLTDQASREYVSAIQEIVNRHGLTLATGHMSDVWQIKIKGEWISEFDMKPPIHPMFKDLERLDKIANKFGIGPTNLERYEPRRAAK